MAKKDCEHSCVAHPQGVQVYLDGHQHHWVLSALRQNVVLGNLHPQFGKKRKATKLGYKSLGLRKTKPKLRCLPASEKYRRGLLENRADHTRSPSW